MGSSTITLLPSFFYSNILKSSRRFKTRRRSRCEKVCNHYVLPAFLVIFLLYLHFRQATKSYDYLKRTTPPRPFSTNHSREFSLPSPPIPVLYKRHTTPWYKYADLRSPVLDTLSATESRHRYLVASAAVQVGDGLGHRFLVVAYERALAQKFNLTYVHRADTHYGSLTQIQGNAVDEFFGWNQMEGMLRRKKFLKNVCARWGRVGKEGCEKGAVYCKKVKKGNGLVDRVVVIPDRVALCMVSKKVPKDCERKVRRFRDKHQKDRTMFVTPVTVCSWQLMMSWQTLTRGWFHESYWKAKRSSTMDPRYVNIAVHVRRGDFLVTSGRKLISDQAYASLVRGIISIVSEEESLDLDGKDHVPELRYRVYIFSEGVFRPRVTHPFLKFLILRKMYGNHDVNDFDTNYVSEKGKETSDDYWWRLLGNNPSIDVDLHISEHTLDGLQEMIAADIFVGSASGLSMHIVSQLSRGIPFVPGNIPWSKDSSKTMSWEPKGNADMNKKTGSDVSKQFEVERFRHIWREYREHIGTDETRLGVMQGD